MDRRPEAVWHPGMMDQASALRQASLLAVRRFLALYQARHGADDGEYDPAERAPPDDDASQPTRADPPKVPPATKRRRRTPGQLVEDVVARGRKRTLYPGVSETLRKHAGAACSEFDYCMGVGSVNHYIPLSVQTVRDAFINLCETADLPSARTGLFAWRGEAVAFDHVLRRAVQLGKAGKAVLLRANTPQSNSVMVRWAPSNNLVETLAVNDTVSDELRRTVACTYSYSTEHETIFTTQTSEQTQTVRTLPTNEPFFSEKTLNMLDRL